MISKTSRVYGDIRRSLTPLLNGIVICIDPSIGSSSSQPGWAVYNCGILRGSGVLSINPEWSVPERLQELRRQLQNLYREWSPDILVYEDIPPLRHGGGGNAQAHASLLKALGVVMSVSGPRDFVGILPTSWKRMARPTYVKGDEADAREIGWIVLQEAARILDIDPPTRRERK